MSHLHAQAAPGDVLERRETVAVDIARVASTCAQHFYSADADPRLMQVCGGLVCWLPCDMVARMPLSAATCCPPLQHAGVCCGVYDAAT